MAVVDNFLGPFHPKSFHDPVTPYLKRHAQYINWGKMAGRVQFAWGQAGYWSAGGETLFYVSLAFLFWHFISLSYCCLPFHYNYVTVFTTTTTIIVLQSLNCSFFNLQVLTSFFFFSPLILLLIPPGVEVCGLSKQLSCT